MCVLAAPLLQCRSCLCLHLEGGLLFSCFCIGALWLRRLLWIRWKASNICSIFPQCMESKALVNSTNNIVACRFFAHPPSRMRRIVKICDLFLRMAFWFFLSMFPILGFMQLRCRTWCIVAAMDVSVIPR